MTEKIRTAHFEDLILSGLMEQVGSFVLDQETDDEDTSILDITIFQDLESFWVAKVYYTEE
jgi:hypothetical protein